MTETQDSDFCKNGLLELVFVGVFEVVGLT
jgi:hypothetical protein